MLLLSQERVNFGRGSLADLALVLDERRFSGYLLVELGVRGRIIGRSLPDLVLQGNLQLLHLIVASVARGALVILPVAAARCVVLHPSVHEIQLLYVHRILAQFGQVTPIDLDAVRVVGVAFMNVGVLAVGATLARLVDVEHLLAGHEALGSARGAALLLALGRTLQRRILAVSSSLGRLRICVGHVGRVAIVADNLVSILSLTSRSLRGHQLRFGLMLMAGQALRLQRGKVGD